jgi:hypothetical protein
MLDNLQRVLIEVTNRGGQHEVRSSLVGRQRGLRALTVGAENLCHLCRPVLWTPAPRSRGWQVLAWPDVRPDVTQELHGRLKRKPARMLTFPTQPTVLRRRPCLRTSRTGRLILEAARADGRRADPVHPRQRLPMDLASLFPGRPHSAQPRPHVSGHDQERGRRPAQRMRNTAHPHRPRPLHTGRIAAPSHPPFGADEARSASTSIDVRNTHAARDDR